jgi:GTP cyclohydrolase I
MDFNCQFIAESRNGESDFVLQVTIPVTSLCPCSKAISDYGAHNQRGSVAISVRTTRSSDGTPEFVWIEELVEVVDKSASAPIYPLLKREDERYVTMQAYDNPVFVEDIVRNVTVKLRQDARIAWFRVAALNHESIHNHNAFAEIEWLRPPSV